MSLKKTMSKKRFGLLKSSLYYSRIVALVTISFVPLIFYSYLGTTKHHDHNTVYQSFAKNLLYEKQNHEYLINTSKCKIPKLDPFNFEVKALIYPKEYTSCSKNLSLLTYIKKDGETITLHINNSVKYLYSYFRISCCYAEVVRVPNILHPDTTIRVSACTSFQNQVVITTPIVYVSCDNIFFLEVYTNVHAVISPKFLPKKKTNLTLKSAFNVLLVGLDSMSHLNLQRSMPKTYHFLEDHKNFIRMDGFVKIALNTLPNLMGFLAGMNLQQWKKCPIQIKIDDCVNIWNVFRKIGYITAYAEDSTSISTFNFEKPGFFAPPTDFYFRPYILAAEALGIRERSSMSYCAGPETEGERIMNVAKDFHLTFNQPKFGVFWMNSFSHDDFNMPGAMDDKLFDFLQEMSKHLEDTILFFFSDHGMRFGDIRWTHSGWLEDRLPFFYIYIPEKFKMRHPEMYRNVIINSKRLTNFYDMYMTLQDLLFLADSTYKIEQSKGCHLCHSIFKEITEERTCVDAEIPEKFCPCNVKTYDKLSEPLKNKLGQRLTKLVNDKVTSYPQGNKCWTYRLQEIKFAGVSQNRNVLVRIKTYPEAIFEALFTTLDGSFLGLKLTGTISRLDRYDKHSWCISGSRLKMYCYCTGIKWYEELKKKFGLDKKKIIVL